MGNCWRTPVDNQSPSTQIPSTSGTSKTNSHEVGISGSSSNTANSRFSAASGSLDEPFPNGHILPTPNLKIFSFAELKIATRNFKPDTLLGEGGFGKVYKGWLDEKIYASSKISAGMVIAVKKLNPESLQGLEEWQDPEPINTQPEQGSFSTNGSSTPSIPNQSKLSTFLALPSWKGSGGADNSGKRHSLEDRFSFQLESLAQMVNFKLSKYFKTSTGTGSSTASSRFSAASGSHNEAFPKGHILPSPNLRSFSLAELKKATTNFRPDLVIGEGGFGRVFKGWLDEKTYAPSRIGTGTVIAVKKLNPENLQGLREWQMVNNILSKYVEFSSSSGSSCSTASIWFSATSGSLDEAFPDGHILPTSNLKNSSFAEPKFFKGYILDEDTYDLLSPSNIGTGMAIAVHELKPLSLQEFEEWQIRIPTILRGALHQINELMTIPSVSLGVTCPSLSSPMNQSSLLFSHLVLGHSHRGSSPKCWGDAEIFPSL
ncbi:hypothetical protein HHK36_030823 [Tetracentron sinense]|uniref:Uncharacterized protein n=1 Tax=Tetracentron sinense TaxID=13715 RepID=A0A834YCU9_TETSI|nr:hypothetical protein HHK36_030823 [Tetracentron sinense]